ncbi:uncharacterized protein METZ01_LOCUS325996, partial [marine metagenome]
LGLPGQVRRPGPGGREGCGHPGV